MTRSMLTFALLAPLALGCDAESAPDTQLRHTYFEAAEVAQIVADAPETTFVVDLTAGSVVHFDQTDESFDLSRFLVVVEEGQDPVPLSSVDATLGLGLEDKDTWTMHGLLSDVDDGESLQFRGKDPDEPPLPQ